MTALPAPLSAALAQQGYDTLTPVQEAMLNPDLAGRDLLVSAQTGSGKTVAFGLAMAGDLMPGGDPLPPPDTPRALIIAPTRELALQVRREFDWLYAGAHAVMASCVGGMDARSERRALERGAHIVVGTPGRLRDHIERGALDLSQLQVAALDEADEMLDLGFREDLEFILKKAPVERRTLLFSATVSPEIERLATTYQRDAQRVATAAPREAHGDITYRALVVSPQDAENAIVNVLRFYEARNTLVFCKTRAAVNHLTARFLNRGLAVVPLSGELAQEERARALQAMRDGRARVCVATDVAARGIDLPGLELVIHADLPTNKETLLHRSGRTGRAGRKGVSVLIVPTSAQKKTQRLLGWASLTAEWGTAPSAAEVTARDTERLLTDESLTAPETADENPHVTMLTERFTSRELAAAVTRLYYAARSAPEDVAPVRIADADARDGRAPREPREAKPRAEFERSFWVKLGVGHEQRAEPRWLLPMLCRAGNLTKDDIGAIRIQTRESYAQIHLDAADRFWGALGDGGILEGEVSLARSDAPEEQPRGARRDGPAPAERKPRAPRSFDGDAPARPERSEAPARAPKPAWQKTDQGDRPARPKRADSADRPARAPYGERPASADRAPYAKPAGDRPYRADRAPKADWAKTDKPARPKRADSDERPARPAYGKPAAERAPRAYGADSDRPSKPRTPRDDGPAKPARPRMDPAAARDPSARLGAPKRKSASNADAPAGKSFGKPGGKPFKPGAKPRPGGDARPTRPGGKAFGKPTGPRKPRD